VWKWILATTLPFFLFLPWTNLSVVISFAFFIFFASFYSAKPIRAKVRPVLDSFFSAGHYVATGVFSFLLTAHTLNLLVDVRWILVIAGILWAMAMHAYSAVPDIRADKEAGFQTIATLFGYKGTVILCGIFYGLAGILSFSALGFFSLIFGL
jgi:4-hydroxybenzoate polyprenyltransferase